jgi:hypothetical protein
VRRFSCELFLNKPGYNMWLRNGWDSKQGSGLWHVAWSSSPAYPGEGAGGDQALKQHTSLMTPARWHFSPSIPSRQSCPLASTLSEAKVALSRKVQVQHTDWLHEQRKTSFNLTATLFEGLLLRVLASTKGAADAMIQVRGQTHCGWGSITCLMCHKHSLQLRKHSTLNG